MTKPYIIGLLVLCPLLILASFLLFFRLGRASLKDWDEAVYANISREMFVTGDWVTPHWMGQPWMEKPPLLIWSTAEVFKFSHPSEFGARFTTALSGLALLVLLPLFGELLGSRWTGILASLMLLTTNEFVFRSRFGTMDVPLTFLIFLALYAYLKAESISPNWWYVVGASLGLGFLLKGVASVTGPTVIVMSLLLDGRARIWKTARCRQFWLGTLVAVAIVAPWHIGMEMMYGRFFWESYLGTQVLARATVGVPSFYEGGRLFYLDQLRSDFSPWFFLSLFALVVTLARVLRERDAAPRILLLVIGAVFFMYTAAATKNPWYLIPLYPALALVSASAVVRAIQDKDPLALGALILGSLLEMLVMPPKVLAFAGLLVVGVYFVLRSRAIQLTPALATVLFGGLLVSGIATLPPLYSGDESEVAHFGKIIEHQFPDTKSPILIVGHPYGSRPGPALAYYANRPYQWAENFSILPSYFASGNTREVFLARKDLEEFRQQYDLTITIQDQFLVYGSAHRKPGLSISSY